MSDDWDSLRYTPTNESGTPYTYRRASKSRRWLIIAAVVGLALVALVAGLILVGPLRPLAAKLPTLPSVLSRPSSPAADARPKASQASNAPTTGANAPPGGGLGSSSAAASPASLPPPGPSIQILFAVDKTTRYTFNTANPASKAADLLAQLGVSSKDYDVGGGLGGLSPSISLPQLAHINDLTGAVYEPSTGRLFLLGVHNPSLPELDPSDLVVALRSVYSSHEDAGVSIDPIDPRNPSGTMKVSYYGQTEGTHFGLVMYEADRYLKTLGLGEDTITHEPVTLAVPGYQSEVDLRLQLGGQQTNPQWHRMWYLLKDQKLDVRVSDDRQVMLFDDVPLGIEARFVQFDSQGNKHDVAGSDPVVDAFVNHFNTHFDAFAAEKPEVGALKQLAKLLSVARWLHDNNAPVDLNWLASYPIGAETPKTTPGHAVQRSKSEQSSDKIWTQISAVFGGVDYAFRNKPLPLKEDGSVRGIREAVENTPLDSAKTSANGDGKTVTGVAISMQPTLLPGALTVREKVMDIAVKGQLPLNTVIGYTSVDQETSPLGKGWRLEQKRMTLDGGDTFIMNGQPIKLYDSLTVVDDATGRQQRFYNTKRIDGDGRIIYAAEGNAAPSEIRYDRETHTFVHQDGLDQYTFDEDGQLRSQARDGEHIDYKYDAADHLTKAAHSSGGQIEFQYDNNKLTHIVGSNGKSANLTYDGERLTDVSGSDGRVLRVNYANGSPSRFQLQDKVIVTRIDDIGRVTWYQDNGSVHAISYNPDGSMIEVVRDSQRRTITIQRNRQAKVTEVSVTETKQTADPAEARKALQGVKLELNSILYQALSDSSKLDWSGFAKQGSKTAIIELTGKFALRFAGDTAVIDGRLDSKEAQDALVKAQPALTQLKERGYATRLLDVQSGAVGGVNEGAAEVVVLVAGTDGALVERHFDRLAHPQDDAVRLVADVGAQAKGLRVTGIFEVDTKTDGADSRRTFAWLTGGGELAPTSPEVMTKGQELAQVQATSHESGRQVTREMSMLMRDAIEATFTQQAPAADPHDILQRVDEFYPGLRVIGDAAVRERVKGAVEASLSRAGQSGEVVKLPPIYDEQFRWLLPGDGPVLLDMRPDLGAFAHNELGANNVRLVGETSTPLHARAVINAEANIMPSQMVVVNLEDPRLTPEEAERSRAAFDTAVEPLKRQGAQIVGIRGQANDREKVLAELSRPGVDVFIIGHMDANNNMVSKGGKISPNDITQARGDKTFLGCCTLTQGLADVAVRAGVDTATGTTEDIVPQQTYDWIAFVAKQFETRPQGMRLSEINHLYRIKTLRDGVGAPLLPMSVGPQSVAPVEG